MGIHSSTYLAYGVRVPISPYQCNEEGLFPDEIVDRALAVPTVRETCPDVSHLTAGAYDRHQLFLVTKCDEAVPGEVLKPDAGPETEAAWTLQIMNALEALGWSRRFPGLEPVGWFVVASES